MFSHFFVLHLPADFEEYKKNKMSVAIVREDHLMRMVLHEVTTIAIELDSLK